MRKTNQLTPGTRVRVADKGSSFFDRRGSVESRQGGAYRVAFTPQVTSLFQRAQLRRVLK